MKNKKTKITSNPSQSDLAAWLNKNNIWHIMSENPPVGSCEEAAANRLRGDQREIPLHDELKTLVLTTDKDEVFLVHARGHRQIDFDKVAATMSTTKKKVHMLESDDLKILLGAEYGTVNPFSVAINHPELRHIFDIETSEDHWGDSRTMMTNSGTFTTAIEFIPREMINLINTEVADIIKAPQK